MRDTPEIKTVLHLSSTSGPGGAEMIFSHLAACVDRSRFRSIACLFRPGWLKDRCDELGIATHVLGMHGMFDWRWVRDCLKLVRREHVALIHAHEFAANTYGTLVARLAGIPLIATVHGKSYYCEQLKRRVAYRAVSRYGTMVAVSDDLKRFIVDKIGIPESRITVIHNGIDATPYQAISDWNECRTSIGIQKHELIIGTVGSLYPVKGHTYLLQAMPSVLRACPHTTLLIVGRGEQELALKEEAHKLKIDHRVHFLGLRRDIPKLLAATDVFVLPSLSEGLSIALLEAMAAGKPVVATRVGGNPELVLDGETGFLVPAQNPQTLAQRLVEVLMDQSLRHQLGATGRQRVLEHYSLMQMAKRYQSLYESRLTRSNPPTHSIPQSHRADALSSSMRNS